MLGAAIMSTQKCLFLLWLRPVCLQRFAGLSLTLPVARNEGNCTCCCIWCRIGYPSARCGLFYSRGALGDFIYAMSSRLTRGKYHFSPLVSFIVWRASHTILRLLLRRNWCNFERFSRQMRTLCNDVHVNHLVAVMIQCSGRFLYFRCPSPQTLYMGFFRLPALGDLCR